MEDSFQLDYKKLDKLRREHGGGYQAATNKEFIMSLWEKYKGTTIIPESGNEYVEMDTDDFFDFCYELILSTAYQMKQR